MRILAASLLLFSLVPAMGEEEAGGREEGGLVVPGVVLTGEEAFEMAEGTSIFPVPEPSRVVLLVIGILAFGLTFRCGLSRGRRRE